MQSRLCNIWRLAALEDAITHTREPNPIYVSVSNQEFLAWSSVLSMNNRYEQNVDDDDDQGAAAGVRCVVVGGVVEAREICLRKDVGKLLDMCVEDG